MIGIKIRFEAPGWWYGDYNYISAITFQSGAVPIEEASFDVLDNAGISGDWLQVLYADPPSIIRLASPDAFLGDAQVSIACAALGFAVHALIFAVDGETEYLLGEDDLVANNEVIIALDWSGAPIAPADAPLFWSNFNLTHEIP